MQTYQFSLRHVVLFSLIGIIGSILATVFIFIITALPLVRDIYFSVYPPVDSPFFFLTYVFASFIWGIGAYSFLYLLPFARKQLQKNGMLISSFLSILLIFIFLFSIRDFWFFN